MVEGFVWDFAQPIEEQIESYGKFRIKQTQDWLYYAILDRYTKLSQLCDKDSPAEKVLLWEMIIGLPEEIQILPQQEVKLPQFSYRVDFLLKFWDSKELIVECDGGKHQKNPEQIREDKKRDRHLQIHGWQVIRFTADEVFWRAEVCVREIRQMLWLLKKNS